MKKVYLIFPLLAVVCFCSYSQTVTDPIITSWIQTPGQTGYMGLASNVQSVSYTGTDVYVSCTCIPGYDIGPWAGNPNVPANQNFCFKITLSPQQNTGTPINTSLGHIGVWTNGVSLFNVSDAMSYNNQGVWFRNAYFFEGPSFDDCLGHPQQQGEYHTHVNPTCLYDDQASTVHSPIIGWAFDGFPIYGAYAYSNTNGTGNIKRMTPSYRTRTMSDRTTLPNGSTASSAGPAISAQFPVGAYIQDFEYVPALGDLDEHNGRFAVTPDYPSGIYAYYVTIDSNQNPVYPYLLGPAYYGVVPAGNTGPQSGHNTIPGGATTYTPVTGIGESESTSVNIYPNPATTAIYIKTNSLNEVEKAEITDALGRVFISTGLNKNENSISLTELSSGVYTLSIFHKNGTHTSRLITKM